MPTINIDADPCPCGSNRLVKDCCLQADGKTLRPARRHTIPPPPKTGLANPSCYSSPLGDCSATISREHYISEAVLKSLNVGSAPIPVTGFHWLKGRSLQVSTAALTANILCSRHNSALSPLDSDANRLMNAFNHLNMKRKQASSAPKEQVFLFNGHNIDRWMLKVLCGVVASGNTSIDGHPITGWRPSELWLRILYGESPFPKGWGLYMPNAVPGAQFFGSWDIKFTALSDGPKMQGVILTFNNFPLLLAMDDPPSDPRIVHFVDSTFRPREIAVDGLGVIVFWWDEKGDDKRIRFA